MTLALGNNKILSASEITSTRNLAFGIAPLMTYQHTVLKSVTVYHYLKATKLIIKRLMPENLFQTYVCTHAINIFTSDIYTNNFLCFPITPFFKKIEELFPSVSLIISAPDALHVCVECLESIISL